MLCSKLFGNKGVYQLVLLQGVDRLLAILLLISPQSLPFDPPVKVILSRPENWIETAQLLRCLKFLSSTIQHYLTFTLQLTSCHTSLGRFSIEIRNFTLIRISRNRMDNRGENFGQRVSLVLSYLGKWLSIDCLCLKRLFSLPNQVFQQKTRKWAASFAS